MTASLLTAALLVFLQWRSGAELSLSGVAVLVVFAYVTFASGRCVALVAGMRDGDVATTWVLGLLALCLGTYAATLVVPLTAGVAFAVIGALVIGVQAWLRRREPLPRPGLSAVAPFALAVALTAAWCSDLAGAQAVLQSDGVLRAWQDYFIHGGVISQFGDPRAAGHGSIYLAGHPSSFYHFASYAAAAALAWPLDRPGLALATSAWLPLGFLAMTAGAVALGTRLAGATGALAALFAVAVLPDASNYGLRNGLFSFHWMMLSHPGGAYALAAAFVSLALLERWSTERSRSAFAVSAALAGSMLFFRAQFFLLFVIPWLATATLCSLPATRRRTLGGVSALALLLAAAAALYLVIPELDAAGWRVRLGSLEVFLDVVHGAQEPTAYTGFYRELVARGERFALAAGIALTFATALGAFLVILPAAVALAFRSGLVRPIDAFAGCVLLWWLFLIRISPEPWIAEGTNLLFQPFPLIYATAAVWTACLLARCIANPRLSLALMVALLVGVVAIAASAPRLAHPKFAWGQDASARRVVPGLIAAADFLRANAARGDIFASSGLREDFDLFDLATQLCSLSGMPAYLSRPYLEMIKGEPRKSVVAARLAALRELERQRAYEAAMQLLRTMNVQWYVYAGERGPDWDPHSERAAFKAGRVALYRTP